MSVVMHLQVGIYNMGTQMQNVTVTVVIRHYPPPTLHSWLDSCRQRTISPQVREQSTNLSILPLICKEMYTQVDGSEEDPLGRVWSD